MQLNKKTKSVIAICIGLASWLLIKSAIKVWLHPILNLPADSDFGSLICRFNLQPPCLSMLLR